MIQDNSREIELINLFNLSPNDQRDGLDATYNLNGKIYPIELKSTTTNSITTSRDVNLNHTRKWKEKIWIIGVYDKSSETLKYCQILPPNILHTWITNLEMKIRDLENTARWVEEVISRDGEKDGEMVSGIRRILKRGITINNPKIPLKLFKDTWKIYQDHTVFLNSFIQSYQPLTHV